MSKIGPTGKFPEGKLTEDDEGELAISVGHENGRVVIKFGKPVSWIGFRADQGKQLGQIIIDHADKALAEQAKEKEKEN